MATSGIATKPLQSFMKFILCGLLSSIASYAAEPILIYQPGVKMADKKPLLRKICFGGLYVAPEWPQGTSRPGDVRLKLDSIKVE